MDNKDIRLLKQMEDSAVSMPELTERSEYTKQQIHYRLTEKLSEYVKKESQKENPGAARSTTVWNLSKAGKEKLESGLNEDKIETFDELSEAAGEARQNAKSAKESVQSYRKKVSRIERRLSSIKEATGETWSDLESGDATVLTQIDKDGLQADYTILESDVKSLEKSLDSLKKDVEDIEYLEDNVTNLENKLAQLRRRTEELTTENSELRTENQELETELDTQRERISELEDRISELEDEDESKSIIEQLADLI